jgi:hypothetical protein
MEDHLGAFIDAIQTTALVVSMMAQIYTMLLLRNEMRAAADAISRAGRRLDAIEKGEPPPAGTPPTDPPLP